MKKIFSVLLALCLVGSLCSCKNIIDYNEENKNNVGNAMVNALCEGYMTEQDGYIYYARESMDKSNVSAIYRMKLDGSDNTKLVNMRAAYISVVGEKMFFAGKTKKGYYALYESGIRGEKPKLILDKGVENVIACGDYVYYMERYEKDGKDSLAYLYRYDYVNMKTETILNFEISGFSIKDDKIYYAKLELDEENKFYRETYTCDLNGKNQTKILDFSTAYLFIDGDVMYIQDFFTNTIWKSSLDGKSCEKFCATDSDERAGMTITKDYLYLNTNDKIVKVSKKDATVIEVCDAQVQRPMQSINNEVYFYGFYKDEAGLYKLIDDTPVKVEI